MAASPLSRFGYRRLRRLGGALGIQRSLLVSHWRPLQLQPPNTWSHLNTIRRYSDELGAGRRWWGQIFTEGILYFTYALTTACRLTVFGGPDGHRRQTYSFPGDFLIGPPSSTATESSLSSGMDSNSVTLNTPQRSVGLAEVG